MPDKNIIIVAPHPDDELIGCFEVVSNYKTFILYDASTSAVRREEAMKLKDEFNVGAQLFLNTVPPQWLTMRNTVLFFPDPVYENHPLHRQWGYAGEMLARAGQNVVFYNTIMNAPYIHETFLFHDKRDALNKCYPSQKRMWEWEHKYYLFEGYNSWKFNLSEVLE